MLVMHQHKSCLAIYQIVGCIKCRRFDYELKAFYLKCKDIYLRKSFLSPFQNTRPLANSYSKFAESLLQICGKFKIRMQINFWQTVCRKFAASSECARKLASSKLFAANLPQAYR